MLTSSGDNRGQPILLNSSVIYRNKFTFRPIYVLQATSHMVAHDRTNLKYEIWFQMGQSDRQEPRHFIVNGCCVKQLLLSGKTRPGVARVAVWHSRGAREPPSAFYGSSQMRWACLWGKCADNSFREECQLLVIYIFHPKLSQEIVHSSHDAAAPLIYVNHAYGYGCL